jgi:hypothetical protein
VCGSVGRAWRAHRARLEQRHEETRSGADRAVRLRELALGARDTLGAMGPRERRAVLNLLEVTVTVTGWSTCPACDGRGKTEGGIGGLPCATCHAMRRVPSLRVERARPRCPATRRRGIDAALTWLSAARGPA